MSPLLLHRNEIAGFREIRFIDRQESGYPTLMRFCMDFDLCVLQVLLVNETTPRFALSCQSCDESDLYLWSPRCDSLKTLESYVQKHQVDILHDYLFNSELEQRASAG